ncbi:MAG: shikimate kinase [Anaeromicrobium sp.]|jgi:shikimate kinase|uniref:shikimate kinase n=1 Tax=Anaeromicrobium sp. TaxID=1929132 RepID=UPI0025F49EB5|nr:shikimate kinase [Anaeromicrobium sp.]MCT4595270.1 shikimate kinase [Anaeromicrobium sp.]
MKNIVLIGMPGCGKTTIGKKVAHNLNRVFIDIDEEIEKIAGKTIPEIFKRGESYFREMETKATEIVSEKTNGVISTGGGIIKNPYNVKIIKRNGVIIFINRPIDNILEDIDTESRPLLSKKENLFKLYEERYDLYKKYCHMEVMNDRSLEEIIKNIINFLNMPKA